MLRIPSAALSTRLKQGGEPPLNPQTTHKKKREKKDVKELFACINITMSLEKYLPRDLANMIYDYVYKSIYYDVLQELDKETWIVEIGPRSNTIIIDGLWCNNWRFPWREEDF